MICTHSLTNALHMVCLFAPNILKRTTHLKIQTQQLLVYSYIRVHSQINRVVLHNTSPAGSGFKKLGKTLHHDYMMVPYQITSEIDEYMRNTTYHRTTTIPYQTARYFSVEVNSICTFIASAMIIIAGLSVNI